MAILFCLQVSKYIHDLHASSLLPPLPSTHADSARVLLRELPSHHVAFQLSSHHSFSQTLTQSSADSVFSLFSHIVSVSGPGVMSRCGLTPFCSGFSRHKRTSNCLLLALAGCLGETQVSVLQTRPEHPFI